MPEKLTQFAYVSHQVHDFNEDELHELMRKARKRNKELDLTGLLLFDKPLFLQILEGPKDSIEQMIESLQADPRHRDLDIIYRNEALEIREFGRWRMGCKILGEKMPADYKKLDERVKSLFANAKPNGDIAYELLKEFGQMKDEFLDI